LTKSPNQKSENLPKSPNQKSGKLSELLTVESVIETDVGSISCLVWKEMGENQFLIFVAAKDGRIKCYKVSLEFLLSLVVSTSRPIEIEIENVLRVETNF
jgi:hypothetical protein